MKASFKREMDNFIMSKLFTYQRKGSIIFLLKNKELSFKNFYLVMDATYTLRKYYKISFLNMVRNSYFYKDNRDDL